MTVDLLNGLISYWKFDGDATDSVGSNDGTVNGATITTNGKINSAYSFNGTSNYIRLPDENGQYPNSEITISAWVKLNNNGKVQTILDLNFASSSMDNNWNGGIIFTINSDNTIYCRMVPSDNQNNSQANGVSSSNTINTNEWYHIIAIRRIDGSNEIKEIYINGDLDNSKTTTNTGNIVYDYSNYDDDSVHIGARTRGGTGYSGHFDGLIDEVGIWSRVLTSTEVSQLYNDDAGLQYPFELTIPETKKVVHDIPSGTFPDNVTRGILNCKYDDMIDGVAQWKLQKLENGDFNTQTTHDPDTFTNPENAFDEDNLTGATLTKTEIGDWYLGKVFSETYIESLKINLEHTGADINSHLEYYDGTWKDLGVFHTGNGVFDDYVDVKQYCQGLRVRFETTSVESMSISINSFTEVYTVTQETDWLDFSIQDNVIKGKINSFSPITPNRLIIKGVSGTLSIKGMGLKLEK